MQYNYSTIYLRKEFYANHVDLLKEINFLVDFDDGFVIWINGIEVLRKNAPVNLSNKSAATESHESGVLVSFDPDCPDALLNNGINTIAVQALNLTLGNSDFYFDMKV